jgi:hypothetical protein
MRPKPSGRFTLREITVKKRIDGQPVEYSTFLLSGWVNLPFQSLVRAGHGVRFTAGIRSGGSRLLPSTGTLDSAPL